jgi:hypothetical protein
MSIRSPNYYVQWRKAHATEVRAYTRKYSKTPNGIRRSRRSNWRKRGISADLAEAVLIAHNNGHCEICGVDRPGGTGGWHVDHDRNTGRIRGILCSNCNRALGYFKDCAYVVTLAALYLDRSIASKIVDMNRC